MPKKQIFTETKIYWLFSQWNSVNMERRRLSSNPFVRLLMGDKQKHACLHNDICNLNSEYEKEHLFVKEIQRSVY